MTQRLEVIGQILDCERCELHKLGAGPVPFTGPAPNYVAVVGEAPGESEMQQGRPFVGPSGQLLRRTLTTAGFNVDQLFICNTVCCNPGRPPSGGEINACSTNLAAQLELANPTWVLLLGGVALSILRKDCKISRARGHVFVPGTGRRLFFVTYHPAYALRQAKAEAVMKSDLATFWRMVNAPAGAWVSEASDDCLGCGVSAEEMGDHDEVIKFDDMGGSWCERCWRKQALEGKAEVRAEKKTERHQEKTGQLFA